LWRAGSEIASPRRGRNGKILPASQKRPEGGIKNAQKGLFRRNGGIGDVWRKKKGQKGGKGMVKKNIGGRAVQAARAFRKAVPRGGGAVRRRKRRQTAWRSRKKAMVREKGIKSSREVSLGFETFSPLEKRKSRTTQRKVKKKGPREPTGESPKVSEAKLVGGTLGNRRTGGIKGVQVLQGGTLWRVHPGNQRQQGGRGEGQKRPPPHPTSGDGAVSCATSGGILREFLGQKYPKT